VHGIRLSNDGLVYVADRENRRVQVFTTDGKFVKQATRYDAIFARDLAFSPDPEQRFIYTGYNRGIAVLDRKTMEYLGTIQPPGIIGPGHLIDTDSKGNIYIGGAGQGMQRLLFKGLGPTPAH
jgi:DNA-binding beta-propeller fold protein YncE